MRYQEYKSFKMTCIYGCVSVNTTTQRIKLMLESKGTIEEGGTYGFKLITAEEIIATVISKSRGEYTLKSPHTVMVNENGAGLGPWPMIAEEEVNVVVPVASIVAVFEPRKDFVSAYIELTSEIVLPKSKIIT